MNVCDDYVMSEDNQRRGVKRSLENNHEDEPVQKKANVSEEKLEIERLKNIIANMEDVMYPVIDSIQPNCGSTCGKAAVFIYGRNLRPNIRIFANDKPAILLENNQEQLSIKVELNGFYSKNELTFNVTDERLATQQEIIKITEKANQSIKSKGLLPSELPELEENGLILQNACQGRTYYIVGKKLVTRGTKNPQEVRIYDILSQKRLYYYKFSIISELISLNSDTLYFKTKKGMMIADMWYGNDLLHKKKSPDCVAGLGDRLMITKNDSEKYLYISKLNNVDKNVLVQSVLSVKVGRTASSSVMTILPGARLLISGKSELQIFDMLTSVLIKKIELPQGVRVKQVSVLDEEKVICLSSKEFRVYNINNGVLEWAVEHNDRTIERIQRMGVRVICVVHSNKTISFWDIEEGVKKLTMNGRDATIVNDTLIVEQNGGCMLYRFRNGRHHPTRKFTELISIRDNNIFCDVSITCLK